MKFDDALKLYRHCRSGCRHDLDELGRLMLFKLRMNVAVKASNGIGKRPPEPIRLWLK